MDEQVEFTTLDEQMAYNEAKDGDGVTLKEVFLWTGATGGSVAILGGIGYGVYKLATR